MKTRLIVSLFVLTFLLTASTPQLPIPVYSLELGQSTFFMQVDNNAKFDFEWTSGWSSIYGDMGEGYILSAMQSSFSMLYVQVFAEAREEYGIMPEDGICYIHVNGDTYFSFRTLNGQAFIYEGKVSQTQCVGGKG